MSGSPRAHGSRSWCAASGPQPKFPYAVLSAVAHGELLGLPRNLTQLSSETRTLGPIPSEATATWFWDDTHLVLGALVFTANRAARFPSLPDQLTALQAWMAELDSVLPTLRPGQ